MYRVAQATQSVNPASMRKNLSQHHLVLTRLFSLFKEKKESLCEGQRRFMAKRIAVMADVELGVLLSFDKSAEAKSRVKDFFSFVKKEDAEIYARFMEGKKCKLLLYSAFLLYPLARKLYLKAIS